MEWELPVCWYLRKILHEMLVDAHTDPDSWSSRCRSASLKYYKNLLNLAQDIPNILSFQRFIFCI